MDRARLGTSFHLTNQYTPLGNKEMPCTEIFLFSHLRAQQQLLLGEKPSTLHSLLDFTKSPFTCICSLLLGSTFVPQTSTLIHTKYEVKKAYAPLRGRISHRQ